MAASAIRNSAMPRVSAEIAAARTWIDMLPDCAERVWTLGNHDTRVDAYLANMAPELDDFAGGLSDRFPEWTFCYSAVINGNVEIRHRFRGGIHTAYQNALNSGVTCVIGHTHQLICTPVVDRHGTRYGVECGTLNDPLGPACEYAEGAPSRQRAGFVLLSFEDGELLPPELAEWRTAGACSVDRLSGPDIV